MRPNWKMAGGAMAAAIVGLGGPALAATAKPAHPCFFSSSWQGWHAPNDKTLYLRVNMHDIYRVDLAGSYSMLTWPAVHLVNVERGSSSICTPLDLDLSVADSDGGFREHLFPTAITKLTTEEVALIPKKDLP